MKRIVVATALALAAAVPGIASAAGSATIAGASSVAYGQQQFGSSAENTGTFCGGEYKTSWWTLPVVVGDHVTIDWEGVGVQSLEVFPLGTNDFNFENTGTLASQGRDTPSQGAELTLDAPASGGLPMLFATSDCNFSREADAGPYDFTAYVRHAVTLAIARRATLARKGTLNVAARTPGGAPISDPGLTVTLRARKGKTTKVIGHATVAGGKAKVPFKVPSSFAHKKVSLSAQATGGSYATKTSSSQSVRVK